MKQGSLRSSAYAVLTAFIWGTAFVAQSVGAEHVPPLAFNAARSVIAFVFLLVLCAVMRSGRRRKGQAASVTRSRKDLLLGGFWCGLTLGLASFLQQKGLDTTSPGKAGFITALYIVLVPIFGIFLKKRVPKAVWVSVLLAVTGLYCLCITESFTVAPGDLCVMLCAFVFTAQILLVDHFVTVVDGVELSCCQFFCHGVFPDRLPAFRASHLDGTDHGGGRYPVCGSPFQRRGLYAANSGSERLQPHGDLSAAESGIRVRHHFRRGDLGRPPQRAGIFRLRPDAGSGGAGTAAGQKKSISPACFFGSGACWLRFFRGHSQRYVLYFSLYEYGIHN